MDTIKFNDEILEVHRTYHNNGELKWEWTQKNGQLHGYRKEFYESGEKELYAEYRNGKRHIVNTFWFENGSIRITTKKSNDLLQSFEYDENQKLICQSDINEEIKVNGYQKRWHPNGKLLQEIRYNENGKPIGIGKVFYKDGSLQMETEYSETEPKFINQINENGTFTIKDGAGILYNYNTDGSVYGTTEIVDGLRNGKGMLFKNGKIHCESNYINGKSEGPTYWYYQNGKVKEIIHMKNGVMERAERNFPMYDNPTLTKTISIKPSERRDNENRTIIPEIYPSLVNSEEVSNSIDLTPDIYNDRPQDLTITEIYRVYLTELGKVKEFNRSSGSGYPVTNELEDCFKLMSFDMKNQKQEGVVNQIWITFKINQIESE